MAEDHIQRWDTKEEMADDGLWVTQRFQRCDQADLERAFSPRGTAYRDDRQTAPEDPEFPPESSPIQDYDFPMPRYLVALLAALTLLGHGQETNSANASDHTALAAALAFEAEPVGGVPGDWSGGPPGTIFADDKVVHGGRWSARIERHPDSPSTFSSITKSIPMDFAGQNAEFRPRRSKK